MDEPRVQPPGNAERGTSADRIFAVTYGIGKAINRLTGFWVEQEREYQGLDLTVHAESAYDLGVLGHGAPLSASANQKVKP